VQGRDWEVLFSEKASGMISYLHQGRQMIAVPPMPDFWRAPTDNDRGNHMAFRHSFWKTASLYSADLKRQPDRIRVKENSVSVSWKYSLPAEKPEDCRMEYTVYPDGTVRVRMTMQLPAEAGDPPLFGVSFKMDADYDRLKWYGLGPEETYCDRCCGAKLGIYETTARKSMAKYLIPQETGNRMGVRWAEVTGEDGHGLRFEGSNMEFSILPYTSHELENALHANELPEVHYTVVRAALGQMGVGGDNSWGAETHPEYHLPYGKKLTFTFTMKAI
jgi:beta-galactosidase